MDLGVCADTGDDIMFEETKQCVGCLLEGQTGPCDTD